MEKTSISLLEKRIESKAKERFDKEFMQLVESITKNKIGQLLKIGEKNLANNLGFSASTILNASYPDKVMDGITNIDTIRDILMKEYIKEETDSILSKLDILSDYLESAQI